VRTAHGPGPGHRVRIDNETADEPVTHIARKNSKERRNDVLMPPDDQELPLAALQGLPQYGRGIGIVMAGKLEDALADPDGDSGGGAAAVLFQGQLALEGVVD